MRSDATRPCTDTCLHAVEASLCHRNHARFLTRRRFDFQLLSLVHRFSTSTQRGLVYYLVCDKRSSIRILCSELSSEFRPSLSVSKSMRRTLQTAAAGQRGLFGHPNLCAPSDWTYVAEYAVQRCDSLVEQTRTTPPGRSALHVLDEISDILCHATDAAAFCAATHAASSWRTAAQKSHQRLQGYLAELNTSSVLWDSLRRSMELAHQPESSGATTETWSDEEMKVGDSLIHEFRQAGMALDQGVQAQYRQFSKEQQHLCAELMAFETSRASQGFTVLGIPSSVADKFPLPRASPFTPSEFSAPPSKRPINIAADASIQRWLLGQPHSSSGREVAYRALHSLPREAQTNLLKLADVRKRIAELVGLPSYMHYQLASAGLTQQPEAVRGFLATTRAMHLDRSEQELQELSKFARDAGLIKGANVGAWDYGVSRVHALGACLQQAGLPPNELQFSASGVMHTLFSVVETLFGVSFISEPAEPGEIWAPAVRKYSAVSDSRGFLGTVFLDLYQRAGKYTTDAHFTLQCGRRISRDVYRHPIVALSCSFVTPDAMLSLSEVKTLFHEVGHALNSVLCDNDLQHLFGARGALDVVELPSHLLERAVMEPTILHQLITSSLRGRDNTSPEALQRVQDAVLLRERFCESLGQMHGLMMPHADALLHGNSPPSTPEQFSREFLDSVASVLPMDVPLGAFPRVSINHVVAYGGLCHSYTFADEISKLVWKHHLKYRPGAGAEVAQLLYRPGGAVNAPAALNQLLPSTATGGIQQLIQK